MRVFPRRCAPCRFYHSEFKVPGGNNEVGKPGGGMPHDGESILQMLACLFICLSSLWSLLPWLGPRLPGSDLWPSPIPSPASPARISLAYRRFLAAGVDGANPTRPDVMRAGWLCAVRPGPGRHSTARSGRLVLRFKQSPTTMCGCVLDCGTAKAQRLVSL
jgi:hypothetical protein